MRDKLSKDGRLRGPLFRGGKMPDHFCDWLGVLEPLSRVALAQPLWSLIAWLANEKAPALSAVDLAKDFCNVRSRSAAQVRLAEAVFDGFLLGYRDWPLWEYVGRRTRTLINESRLSSWRKALATRFRGVTSFHEERRSFFFKGVNLGDVRYAHHEFDSKGYRVFIDRTVQKLLDQLSALVALRIEAVFPGSVIARFEGQVLCEGKPTQRAEITAHLAAAFPHSTFPIAFEGARQ